MLASHYRGLNSDLTRSYLLHHFKSVMAPAEQPKYLLSPAPMFSSNQSPRYLGITDPISVSPPTEAEEAATIAMMEELHRQGVFESAEDSKRRCVPAFPLAPFGLYRSTPSPLIVLRDNVIERSDEFNILPPVPSSPPTHSPSCLVDSPLTLPSER